MGDTFFRSVKMTLVQLYIPSEIGRESIAALGELGCLHFRDLNSDVSAFQRAFVKEIRRLDNTERQLRFFTSQMEKLDVQPRSIEGYTVALAPSVNEIDELAERSTTLEERLNQLNESYETLEKRYTELIELRHVLRETGVFFDRAHGNPEEIRNSFDNDTAPLLESDVEQQNHRDQRTNGGGGLQIMNIGFVAGVIPRERTAAFERILWRTLRGNLYMNQTEIEQAIVNVSNGEKTSKNVFVIFAHGKEIINKIRKISESLGATLYPVDEDSTIRRGQISEVNSRIDDINSVLQNTKNTLYAEIRSISENQTLWTTLIKKEKAIYHALNLFNYDQSRRSLIAEAWVPMSSLSLVQTTLRDVTERAGLQISSILNELKTTKTPPTYHITNKFTAGFQSIIDAYGVSKYREVNPGLATIITFPFLFAVMFGDLGHGFLMFLAALGLVFNERKISKMKRDEIFDLAFYGRYIILLMGAFSMYTGLLYNDIFSKNLVLFKSGWAWPEDFQSGDMVTAKQVGVYPIGLDPAWHPADNNLLFTNSLKMKLSIIMGYSHMTYSFCNSLINSRYFKTNVDIIGNFIPGMLFLQSIFGYLVICILYKWSVNWPATGRAPPSLLNMLIYMFLSPGTIEDQLYPGQAVVQTILLLTALVCVPWMLLLKPLYLRWQHKRVAALGYRGIGHQRQVDGNDEDEDFAGAVISEEMHEEEEFDFSEIMIHQVM